MGTFWLPKTCTLRSSQTLNWFLSPVGVTESVYSCLSLYVVPVMNWQTSPGCSFWNKIHFFKATERKKTKEKKLIGLSTHRAVLMNAACKTYNRKRGGYFLIVSRIILTLSQVVLNLVLNQVNKNKVLRNSRTI